MEMVRYCQLHIRPLRRVASRVMHSVLLPVAKDVQSQISRIERRTRMHAVLIYEKSRYLPARSATFVGITQINAIRRDARVYSV